jgi:hypothetical protein
MMKNAAIQVLLMYSADRELCLCRRGWRSKGVRSVRRDGGTGAARLCIETGETATRLVWRDRIARRIYSDRTSSPEFCAFVQYDRHWTVTVAANQDSAA